MDTWILPKQLHTLAYALDTAALNLDSSEQSQVCAQSLFVRSKPSQLRIWSAKWKRDSWTRHLSGRILRPSLGQRFATEWTSSLGATHASPSVQQANDSEVKTPGISGRISQEAFQFFNQESASLKTSRATLPVGCITFCATWEDWVTEQRGAYSQRLNAERLTNASGCSSWPTPQVGEEKVCMTGTQNQRMLSHAVIDGLADQVSLSTPGSRPGLWHTPEAHERTHTPRKCGHGTIPLANQVAWRTPDTSDRRSSKSTQIGLSNQMSGKLNPRWVETLMGLPVGWTMPSCASPVTIERMNSDSLVTVLSQQQQNEHSER
jgi:hypothetical protein